VWETATDNGVGFQKYQIFVDGAIKADGLTDTTWSISTPLTNGQHTWYVKVFDNLGNNQSSATKIFYVDTSPPNLFSLVSPTDSQVVNLPTPNFSWQATTDFSGGSGLSKYQLWIDGVVNIDSLPVGTTTTAPNLPLSESPHTWFVKAYDKVGNVRTSTQTRTVFVDFNPPTTFDLISPASNETVFVSRPVFTWHPSSDIGSGLLRYELHISGQSTLNLLPTDTSVQLSSNLPNGTYTWFVNAVDRAGRIRNSNQTDWKVVVNVISPSVPILLSPPSDTINQLTTLTLTWNPSTGAETYRLQVSTDSLFGSLFVNDSTLTTTSRPVGPLLNDVKYYWHVRAKNIGGISDWSSTWYFKTIVQLPSQVLLLLPINGATVNTDSVNCVWQKGTPAIIAYWYERATDSLFTINRVIDSSLIDSSYITHNLVNGQTYWWMVKAKNAAGWGPFSEKRKFNAIIVAVNDEKGLPQKFSLKQNYPNPFNPSCVIQYALPERSQVILKVYNLLGQEVATLVNEDQPAGYYDKQFDSNGLTSGIYIYRIVTSSGFSMTRKMLLLR
jgi:hypothetical protein